MLDTLSMAEKLSGAYRTVFEKADMYSTMAASDQNNTDDKLMDLFDILMEAQQEGKSAEKIIGNDIEAFCRDFFDEEKKEKGITKVLVTVYHFLRVVLVLTILDMTLLEEESQISTKSDIMPFVCGIGAGLILCLVFKYCLEPLIFKTRKIKPILYYFIIIALFAGAVLLSLIAGSKTEIEINNLTLLWISGPYVVLYLLIRSIWRYKKFGTIRKPGKTREEKKIQKEFNDEIFVETLANSSASGMAKRFCRLARRNEKKGKGAYTFEQFAAKIRKEESKQDKLDFIMAIVFLAIVLVPAISEMINNTIVDGLIFGGILGVIEFFIYRFFKKTNGQSSRARLRVLEECERQGIGIVEYAKQIEEEKL